MSGPINTPALVNDCREILEEERSKGMWWVNYDLLREAIYRLEALSKPKEANTDG